jgi:hypothetical protein
VALGDVASRSSSHLRCTEAALSRWKTLWQHPRRASRSCRAASFPHLISILGPLVASTIAAAAASPETAAPPDLEHFRSRSIAIDGPALSTVTNILPPPEQRVASDVRARIGLTLTNKAGRPLWLVVRLTPPPPEPGCPAGTAHLGPGEKVEFRCTPEGLVADVDYPLEITVCADSALTDTLEQNTTRLRFDRGIVERMEERLAFRRRELEAEKQPRTGESKDAKDEPGFRVALGLSGGIVIPTGEFSDGFGAGGMGAISLELQGRMFGVRLLLGSSEPGTRSPTNDAYSARLGRRVEVTEAIVPVELQGIAAFPARTRRLGLTLQAGAGLHAVTVRLKNTDDRIDDDTRFGFSAGGGVRYAVHRLHATVGLNGVLHGTGSSRYATVELELVLGR